MNKFDLFHILFWHLETHDSHYFQCTFLGVFGNAQSSFKHLAVSLTSCIALGRETRTWFSYLKQSHSLFPLNWCKFLNQAILPWVHSLLWRASGWNAGATNLCQKQLLLAPLPQSTLTKWDVKCTIGYLLCMYLSRQHSHVEGCPSLTKVGKCVFAPGVWDI